MNNIIYNTVQLEDGFKIIEVRRFCFSCRLVLILKVLIQVLVSQPAVAQVRQRIKGFAMMRYTNRHFTYLFT